MTQYTVTPYFPEEMPPSWPLLKLRCELLPDGGVDSKTAPATAFAAAIDLGAASPS